MDVGFKTGLFRLPAFLLKNTYIRYFKLILNLGVCHWMTDADYTFDTSYRRQSGKQYDSCNHRYCRVGEHFQEDVHVTSWAGIFAEDRYDVLSGPSRNKIRSSNPTLSRFGNRVTQLYRVLPNRWRTGAAIKKVRMPTITKASFEILQGQKFRF